MPDNQTRRIFVESPAGERFEADVPCGVKIGKIAADFYEVQTWPTQDARGHGQRAVVELVNPQNPDDTKRLNSDQDICESGVRDGDTLRVFPESIAGIVDERARLRALIADYNEIEELARTTPGISFTSNRDYAPDRYTVTFTYPSFVELLPDQSEPRVAGTHRVDIILGDAYPRAAPVVTWQTPIFHPNIRQTHPPEADRGHGAVCLGVLRERYLPGMGLGRLVRMLAEMLQWRNFDAANAFNPEAAKWAADPKNWETIRSIGGHPFQGTIDFLVKALDRATQPAIVFRPVAPAP